MVAAAIVAMLTPTAASAANFVSGINIESSAVGSTLTDFPVFVDLADMPAVFWSEVTMSGGDIRIYTDTGVEVPYELASFNKASTSGALYFKAPALSASNDTLFIIHYGDSSRSGYAASATYGSQNVWKSAYKAVLHLEEEPTGQLLDSTSNGNHASSTAGAMTADDKIVGAMAGYAVELDGVNDKVEIPDASSLDWEYNDAFSVTGWVRAGVSAYFPGLLDKVTSQGSNSVGWACLNNTVSGQPDSPMMDMRSTTNYVAKKVASVDQGLDDNEWHHIACTYSGSGSAADQNLFADGALITSTSIVRNNLTSHSILNSTGIDFGDHEVAPNGAFDELRLIEEELSEDWINAEYLNTSDPSSFYTIYE